jgi:ribonuclease G
MDNQIVIHASDKQKRIALIENGELAQFFIESPENRRSVGDIYLAQVHKVMSGIRAAFIDISTPKDAFLHYSDLGEHLEEYLVMLNGRDSVSKQASEQLREFRKKMTDNQLQGMSGREQSSQEQNHLGNLLQPGQKIMVQIVKEPIGSKGPRVSTDITIAGRFLVLIPFGDYVAVSKRIRSFKERRRLRSVISNLLPTGFGVIVRTVAEGQDEKALIDDLKELHEKWLKISELLKTSKPTTLLHRDLDMTESLVRDLFSKNYNRILVDEPAAYKMIRNYIGKIAPNMLKNVEHYKGREHIFDHMRISRDVDSIFSPRVKMPSGGYLIFEQTEAMYVVDVNSGRYAAKKLQEDNSLKTNLEAAREIAKQLRLRDIGGIIVVDFIDLQDDSNRKKVYDELKKEFRKDRAKTNVLAMSDFGLVQITRQRIRPSVVKSVSKVCPMCGGSGSIVSESTLLSDIESWLTKFRHDYKHRSIDMYVNPHFHSVLCQGFFSQRLKWIFKYWLKINIIPDETVSLNDYKVTLHNSEIDISDSVLEGKDLEEVIRETERSIAELESEGKKDEKYLDIYKKEDRRKNGNTYDDNGSSKRRGSTKDKPSQNDKEDAKDVKKKTNVRLSTQSKPRDKAKSKYYKSSENEPSEALPDTGTPAAKKEEAVPVENKPDALEVARAYAQKVQKDLLKSEPEIKSDEKKAEEIGETDQKSSTGDTAKTSETAEKETLKKTVKAPKKVKRQTKSPRKKTVTDSDDKIEESGTGKKSVKEKKVTTVSDKVSDEDTPAESGNGSKTSKIKDIDIIDKVKATLEEELQKKSTIPAGKSVTTTIKKSTVKKRATPVDMAEISEKQQDSPVNETTETSEKATKE